MNDLELLMKKIPKEHWTEHGGKPMLVRDLIKILDEEIERIDREKQAVSKRRKKQKNEQDSSDGLARRGEDDVR